MKKRRMSPALIVLIIVIVVAIVFVSAFFIVRAILSATEEKDYYEIGSDRVPSIKLALGEDENRKLTGTSVNVSSGTTTKTFSYNAEGATDGIELFEYAMFLEGEDFKFLTDGDFSRSRGTAIQMGRNSDESGYMLVIQFDWEPGKYTITLMRSQGSVTVFEDMKERAATLKVDR